jgi:hypothetical protein
MANYHFIGGDGKEYGPYSLEELRQFMAEDRLNAQTQIQVDDGAFQPASSLPELMGAPAPLPPVPGTMVGMPPPTIRPGKLQAIAIMTLVGGILATLFSIFWILYGLLIAFATMGIGCICLIGPIFQLVAGILCIIQGSKLLGKNPDPHYAKTKKTAIMQIICIICFDWINMVLGIINLVFLNDEQVKAYIRSRGGQI